MMNLRYGDIIKDMGCLVNVIQLNLRVKKNESNLRNMP